MLPNWVEISEKKINEILSTASKAKNEGLQTNVDGREVTLDNTESLLKDLGNGILNCHEFKNRYNNIVDDIKTILNKPMIRRNGKKIIEIMGLLKEIIKTKLNEEPDTTDMPELESEESAAGRRNQSTKNTKNTDTRSNAQ